MERTEIIEIRYMEYEEHYAVFTASALVLIFAAALAGQTLLRRLP